MRVGSFIYGGKAEGGMEVATVPLYNTCIAGSWVRKLPRHRFQHESLAHCHLHLALKYKLATRPRITHLQLHMMQPRTGRSLLASHTKTPSPKSRLARTAQKTQPTFPPTTRFSKTPRIRAQMTHPITPQHRRHPNRVGYALKPHKSLSCVYNDVRSCA